MLTWYSSISQIVSWSWKHLIISKCSRNHITYYIVVCATLWLSFSSKSNITNVFPKYILKLEARDKSIQARNKLYCHLTVKDCLCNVLWKFLIKVESTRRGEIKEQAPSAQLILLHCGRSARSSHQRCSLKKAVFKNFVISTGNTFAGVSFLKSWKSEGLHLY